MDGPVAELDSEWERTISRNDFSLMKEHFEGEREKERGAGYQTVADERDRE